jgi:hypothetical protein
MAICVIRYICSITVWLSFSRALAGYLINMRSRSAAWWTIVAGLFVFVALIATKIWFAAIIGILIAGWGVYLLSIAGGAADSSKSGLQRLRDR